MKKGIDKNKEEILEIKKALSIINNNIGTLSSSTNEVLSELSIKPTDNIMPKPDLSEQIRTSILELINIEVLLNKDLKIPNKQSTTHIIDNIVATYPNVNKEYIVKLTLAMIENYTQNIIESSIE